MMVRLRNILAIALTTCQRSTRAGSSLQQNLEPKDYRCKPYVAQQNYVQRSRLGDQRTRLEFQRSRVEFREAGNGFQGKSSLRFREASLSFREPGLSFKVTRILVLSLITPAVMLQSGTISDLILCDGWLTYGMDSKA